MAKIKSKWICQNCGYETTGYLGKCPDCSSWGSIVEEVYKVEKGTASKKVSTQKSIPQILSEIEIDHKKRLSSGMVEFDRVLGGGFVQGSLVLVAGDPGIGKSTIILQASNAIAKQGKVLYISAEESAHQIKLRANRLKVESENLFILAENDLDLARETIESMRPDFVIVDSIQAVFSSGITSSVGSVSQVKECCNILMHIAKQLGITVVVVGHVTKDGTVAGPKVLEHMVDAVLYFEGEKYNTYRILRAIKNRFGATSEVGMFAMEDDGLIEVSNPSEIFLKERNGALASGNVIIATGEGTRPLLVEIQALVGPSSYAVPRRVATGVEYNRVLKVLAVLERRVGLNFSKHDVYINIIGGLDVKEPAADLGIALAIASCAKDAIVDEKTVIVGEVGLSGEVRAISQVEARVKEAENMGFEKIIIPKGNLPLKNKFNIKTVGVSRLLEAITETLSRQEI
ncbi:MAG: DNA repair protein RadA [bacterium]